MNYLDKAVLFIKIIMLILFSNGNSLAQTDIDTPWKVLNKSIPLQENSQVWQKLANNWGIRTSVRSWGECISGDCENGYGVQLSNDNGLSPRYQYEGSFTNGRKNGYGVVKRKINDYARVSYWVNGYEKEENVFIIVENGLAKYSWIRYDIEDIKRHQSYSFSKFSKCNCLEPATHVLNEPYQQAYTVKHGNDYYKSTEYRTEYRNVKYEGFRNVCDKIVYIKAISQKAGNSSNYFRDESYTISPGNTIMKVEFSENYLKNPNKFSDGITYLGQFTNGTAQKEFKVTNSDKLSPTSSTTKENIESLKNSARRINDNSIEVTSYSNTSNIFVKKSEKINIKASGNVSLGTWAGSGGPDGINGYTNYNRIEGFKHGSLLVRVGDKGTWEAVGTSKSIIAKNDGVLQFIVNDEDPSNNSGSFIVEYSINNSSNITKNNSLSFADLLDNTSNSTTNDASNIDDNKFLIRNYYNTRVYFELSRDKSTWSSYSLAGSSKSDYWYTDQQQGFFRIKMLTEKVYKIEAGKKYKIDWNKSEWCFDLFPDGDR